MYLTVSLNIFIHVLKMYCANKKQRSRDVVTEISYPKGNFVSSFDDIREECFKDYVSHQKRIQNSKFFSADFNLLQSNGKKHAITQPVQNSDRDLPTPSYTHHNDLESFQLLLPTKECVQYDFSNLPPRCAAYSPQNIGYDNHCAYIQNVYYLNHNYNNIQPQYDINKQEHLVHPYQTCQSKGSVTPSGFMYNGSNLFLKNLTTEQYFCDKSNNNSSNSIAEIKYKTKKPFSGHAKHQEYETIPRNSYDEANPNHKSHINCLKNNFGGKLYHTDPNNDFVTFQKTFNHEKSFHFIYSHYILECENRLDVLSHTHAYATKIYQTYLSYHKLNNPVGHIICECQNSYHYLQLAKSSGIFFELGDNFESHVDTILYCFKSKFTIEKNFSKCADKNGKPTLGGFIVDKDEIMGRFGLFFELRQKNTNKIYLKSIIRNITRDANNFEILTFQYLKHNGRIVRA